MAYDDPTKLTDGELAEALTDVLSHKYDGTHGDFEVFSLGTRALMEEVASRLHTADPEPSYTIQVGRDACVYYSAKIPADLYDADQ